MTDHPRVLLHPGAKLDRYQLLCPLADGGMAAVWLGRVRAARGLERLVAIKTIKPQLREDARLERMFLDEARIASRIHHPNVAQLIDVGEASELLFLVMEYVDGESLSRTRRVAEKAGVQLPLDVSLRIIADVCAGLHAAHELRNEQGAPLEVVHRDVSPQNVLVTPHGEVKLIDFGIARAQDRSSAETTAGNFKGKVPYMAPEQITARDYDRRVDLWAAGVMLYELLAGKRPFVGADDFAVFKRITSGEPPPPLPATVPAPVRQIVARALSFEPSARFATASEMRDALEAAVTTLGLRGLSTDVAAFVQQHLAVQTTQRRALVRTAVETTNQLEAILEAAAPRNDPDDDAPTRVRPSPEDEVTHLRVPVHVADEADGPGEAPTQLRVPSEEPPPRELARPAPRPPFDLEEPPLRTTEGTLTHSQLETERRGFAKPGGRAFMPMIAVAIVSIVGAMGFRLARREPAPEAAAHASPSVAPLPSTPASSAANAASASSATASASASSTNPAPAVSNTTKPPKPRPKPAATYDKDGI
jgi:serine/threonine protein kinase